MVRRIVSGVCAAIIISAATPALAAEMRAGGKLRLTGGITNVEGAAGGGIATWAVIAGNETADGIGATAHLSYIPLADYDVVTFGGAVGIGDRLEFSYARQRFDTQAAGAALGLGAGYSFSQDVFGVKLRLFGDAVYDQDSILPQVAIGLQHKRANRGAVIRAVGGRDDSDTDFYIAATKILLGQSLVLNGTARLTRANQFGLLGFGGDRNRSYSVQLEGSAGLLLSKRLLVGGEYRTKPDNLGFAREDDAYDVFAAYAISRNLTATAAYVDLGSIATLPGQRGAFLSLQASY